MSIRLFTSYYTDPSPVRQAELLICLERNLSNSYLDEVHLLIDDTSEPPFKETSKIKTHSVDSRPSYTTFFTLANACLTGEDDLSLIANSDIWFSDEAVSLISSCGLLSKNSCFALSRWDEDASGNSTFCNAVGSQDTWVFKGVIRPMKKLSYGLGIPSCDQALAYHLRDVGYRVLNPSRSIQSFHLHLSDIRNYTSNTPKVASPYLFLPPTFVDTPNPTAGQFTTVDEHPTKSKKTLLKPNWRTRRGNFKIGV